jgi:hypothetical protein
MIRPEPHGPLADTADRAQRSHPMAAATRVSVS